jgi:ribulose-5-phosphate 4-epimerase/fuculose-1-phosphate aldolase
MHLHTRDGVAVSAMEEGLLPLNQSAMFVAKDVAYHEFEGVAVNMEERERLAADLGEKNLMILRNHGTLAVGTSVCDAFYSMYQLETACTIQVRTLGMGREVHQASQASFDQVAGLRPKARTFSDMVWAAMLRKLDRHDPHWRG